MKHFQISTLQKRPLKQSGFTLIELLVVLGVLAILLAITIVAINPSKHFIDARNAQRQNDVTTILNGIYSYEAANKGVLPPSAASLGTVGIPLGAQTTQTATNTTLAGSNVTYTVGSGNTNTSGPILVTGCSNTNNNGNFTITSGTTTTIVVSNATGSSGSTGCVIATRLNLCTDLVSTYIAAMVMDPSSSTGTQCALPYLTGYTISTNAAGNRYVVSAPSAEGGATISVTE